jgi:integrase
MQAVVFVSYGGAAAACICFIITRRFCTCVAEHHRLRSGDLARRLHPHPHRVRQCYISWQSVVPDPAKKSWLALAKITRKDIAALLANVDAASGPSARNRLRASLSTFFAFAIAEGIVDHSPVTGTAMAHEVTRDRVLSDDELAAVWNALDAGDYGDLVRLLMLTGARRQELGSLTWSEIDFAARVITLPASRVKNKEPHQIPLSQMAFDILAARHTYNHIRVHTSSPINGNAGSVFGKRGLGFTTWADGKASLDRMLGPAFRDWRLHDVRKSVATGMARIGVSIPVIEKVLNHQSGIFAGIVGVYQRHDFADEKRDALEKWASHVMSLTAPSEAILPPKAVA